MIASTAVMDMPDGGARARTRRLASPVRRLLLACFVSMTPWSIILHHQATLLLLRSTRPFLSGLNAGAPRPQNLGKRHRPYD